MAIQESELAGLKSIPMNYHHDRHNWMLQGTFLMLILQDNRNRNNGWMILNVMVRPRPLPPPSQ